MSPRFWTASVLEKETGVNLCGDQRYLVNVFIPVVINNWCMVMIDICPMSTLYMVEAEC